MKSLTKISRVAQATLLSLGLIALPSCSTIAGQGIISEKTSAYDQAKVLTMSPAGVKVLRSGTTGIYPQLGAVWSSTAPSSIGLILQHNGATGLAGANSQLYVNIKGLDVNIDGKKHSYNTTGGTSLDSSRYYNKVSGFSTSSSNSVIVPKSVVQKMVNAQSCILRVRTNKGSAELDFSNEGVAGVKFARPFLREFLAKVGG